MRLSSSTSSKDDHTMAITERTPLLPEVEETAPVEIPSTEQTNEVTEPEPLAWSLLIPALGSLWLVLFLAALDGTIVVTLASVISSSFHASEKSAWLGSSYLLTVCAFSPIYGRLSDIVGRKGSMITAITFFTIGTFGCAVASSMNALLISRAVAGIGGGGVLLSGSIILTDLVSLRQRGVYQGLTNIIFGAGAGLGGPIGGLINDFIGWRFAFMMQVPLLILASVCILKFIKIPTPASDQTLKQKLARIDYLGSLFLILGVSSLLLSLSFLSADKLPLSNPKVYGLLISFVVFLVLFVSVEGLVVKEPILPLDLLKTRAPLCIGAFYFFSSVAYYSFIFNFAIYFQAVRLQASREAGLHLLPLSAFTSTGSLLSGLYMKSTGRYFSMNLICSFLAVSGSLYITYWNESTTQWEEYLGACPSGFGIAANYTFLLIALLAKVKKEDQAVATGMVYLFRSLGQVVGVALSGALLQSLLSQSLEAKLTTGEDKQFISIIRHDANLIPTLPPHVRRAATESYAYSLSRVFFWVSMIQIFCIALCAGVGNGDLGEKKKGVVENGREERGESLE